MVLHTHLSRTSQLTFQEGQLVNLPLLQQGLLVTEERRMPNLHDLRSAGYEAEPHLRPKDILDWPRISGTHTPVEISLVVSVSVVLCAALLTSGPLPGNGFGQWLGTLMMDAPLIAGATLALPLFENARLKRAIRNHTALHQAPTF